MSKRCSALFIHCAHEPSALHDPDALAGQSLVSDIADTSARRDSGRVVGGWVAGYGVYIYSNFAHTLKSAARVPFCSFISRAVVLSVLPSQRH